MGLSCNHTLRPPEDVVIMTIIKTVTIGEAQLDISVEADKGPIWKLSVNELELYKYSGDTAYKRMWADFITVKKAFSQYFKEHGYDFCEYCGDFTNNTKKLQLEYKSEDGLFTQELCIKCRKQEEADENIKSVKVVT